MIASVIKKYNLHGNSVILESEDIYIRISIYSDNIVRVWSSRDNNFKKIKHNFILKEEDKKKLPIKFKKSEGFIDLISQELIIRINLNPFNLLILNKYKECVFSSPQGETLEWKDGRLIQRVNLPEGVGVYGLGQGNYHSLNLRNLERRMWQQWDCLDYSGNNGIPFLMTSQGYGVLLNSSWASRFAIGTSELAEISSVARPEAPWASDEHSGENNPERYSILTENEEMDIFVIYGPDYKRILKGYNELTGFPPILPRWALGYIQCKNRYKNQNELLEIARGFRKRNIPGDVIIIDWNWFAKFGDLSWLRRDWPEPTEMLNEIHALGFKVMQAQHPYMHDDSINFSEFKEKGYLIFWNPDDNRNWPQDRGNHAVDFSNPEARELWGKKVQALFKQGIDGYWIDMGELETHPKSSTPQFLGPREKVHNIYSLLWSKALYDWQRSISNKRVFILSRSTFAGMQRYSTALWSGDINSSWEVLKNQVIIGQQVCMSGQPYWTTDIGGFISTTVFYEPELYVRWFQWGAFCPIFRTHGTRPDNEPWSFGPMAESIIKKYIRLRYRLMPYIYSLARETSSEGLAIMRAMLIEYPDDTEAVKREYQFMFGSSILVAPVVEKGAREKAVYLPKGTWYGFWDEKIYKGPVEVIDFAPLDKIPLFVKEGSIIPESKIINSTVESQAYDLILHIYTGRDSTYTLYEDDGKTYDYENGHFAEVKIDYKDKTKTLNIKKVQGDYSGFPRVRNYKVVYHNIGYPEKISVNDILLKESEKKYETSTKKLEIFIKNQSTCIDLNIKPQGLKSIKSKAISKKIFYINYDFEYLPDSFGFILRVYLDNRKNNTRNDGVVSISMPPGWQNKSKEQVKFNLDPNSIKTLEFTLQPISNSFTVNSIVVITVSTNLKKEEKKIQLGSGWATWWKLAGPYKVNKLEDFNKIYLPEKLLKIDKSNIEPGISVNSYIDFNCFGYVNIDKSLGEKDLIIQTIENPEYQIAYGSCYIKSPEDRECFMQIKGENRFKVWINKRLTAIVEDCIARPVEYHVALKRGKNHVLIKCSFDARKEWNDRAWGFYFRFLNEKRGPLDDIIYSEG